MFDSPPIIAFPHLCLQRVTQQPPEAVSASHQKPLAVPALTPLCFSPQIDFTADQVEGEY